MGYADKVSFSSQALRAWNARVEVPSELLEQFEINSLNQDEASVWFKSPGDMQPLEFELLPEQNGFGDEDDH